MPLGKWIFRSYYKQRSSYKFHQIYWIIESISYSPDRYGRTNVNWKFDGHIVSDREDGLPSHINIGSCNLHVVNGGFKIGAESANWKLKKILKACFTIFHNTHARRDHCTSVTGSTIFSLFFFAARYAFFISWMIFVTCMILCHIGG